MLSEYDFECVARLLGNTSSDAQDAAAHHTRGHIQLFMVDVYD